MHTYATDTEDRNIIPTILAVAAIAATLIFIFVIQMLKIQIPWWIDAPSIMGFYGIFYQIYNRVLWRTQFGPLHLSKIPNVNGVWAGVLTSSYNNSRFA